MFTDFRELDLQRVAGALLPLLGTRHGEGEVAQRGSYTNKQQQHTEMADTEAVRSQVAGGGSPTKGCGGVHCPGGAVMLCGSVTLQCSTPWIVRQLCTVCAEK